MKLFFNKTVISIIVLGMAGSSYATMSSNGNTAWSPHFKGWFIGGDALDLQPRNDDLDYVTVFPNTSTGALSTKAISPNYDWGFRLFGGIKFGDNDDLTLGWTRFHTNDSSSIANPAGSSPGSLGDSDPRWLFYDQWKNINANVSFDLDDVWLVMGHTINFNNPWSVRFAGGLEYAKLDSDLQVQATYGFKNSKGVYETYGFDNTLDLKGIGPRVEGNAVYHLPSNFALFMDANAALLISRRDIALDTLNASGESGSLVFPSITFSTRHVVVPHLGMRIGVNWSYYFGQAGGEGATCNVVSVEAGWQADTYIDAIERVDNSNSYISPGTQAVSPYYSSNNATTKTSSYSNQGLFLGINFSSNWF